MVESVSIQTVQKSNILNYGSSWLSRIRGYLFIALGFTIPLSSAAISIFYVLIFMLWIAERNFCSRIQYVCKNPVYIWLRPESCG